MARVRRGPAELRVAEHTRLDRDRTRRIGLPEVVLAEGKTIEQLLAIVRALARRGDGAIVSRPSVAQRRALSRTGLNLHERAGGRVVRLAGPLGADRLRGTVGVVAAGTSDVRYAEESCAVLEELGLEVVRAYDVGVAGLHRLLRALDRLERHRPGLFLVFAGREGALPTVVSGLVRRPVVGVPTSVGYGRGGRGEAALSAMLQSCAPIAVVNIDAAVPAALFAAHHFVNGVRRSAVPRRRRRRRRARP